MTVIQLLNQKGLTKYRLSKASGIPQATINDICSGKTRIEKCSADTLYKISKVLGVTMEELIESAMKRDEEHEMRSNPITMDQIKEACTNLYGSCDVIPKDSMNVLKDIFASGSLEDLYLLKVIRTKKKAEE